MSKTRKDNAASEFDFSEIEKKALKAVAGLYEIPEGAYNFRINGKAVKSKTTATI